MIRGTFGEVSLQVINFIFGLAALALVARGLVADDGLAGLGLAVLMATLISGVGIAIGVEQAARECAVVALAPDAGAEIIRAAS